MNTGSFAGRIGRDAELKTIGDSKVANFSLAVSTWKNGEDATLWVSCALWGQRAEKLAQYLTKGSAVSVTGDVDVRAYSSKDGAPKAEITCNVQRVTLQGGREQADAKPQTNGAKPAAKPPVDDFEPDQTVPF